MQTNNDTSNAPDFIAAAGRVHEAASAYLDGAGSWEELDAAREAFRRALGDARSAHERARPDGRLPREHPWHQGLRRLNDDANLARDMTVAIVRRAEAMRAGRLDDHDRARDAETARENRWRARAAAEVDRREARTHHPLPAADVRAIFDAHRPRG